MQGNIGSLSINRINEVIIKECENKTTWLPVRQDFYTLYGPYIFLILQPVVSNNNENNLLLHINASVAIFSIIHCEHILYAYGLDL